MCWAKYNFLSSHCLLALVKIYRGNTSIFIGDGFLNMTLISNHVIHCIIQSGSHISLALTYCICLKVTLSPMVFYPTAVLSLFPLLRFLMGL